MTESSRRGFLKYAGAGVAVAGAATVVPTALAGSADAAEPARSPAEPALPTGAEGPMTIHIDDVTGDEMTLMIEDHEVVVHDKALVTRLARHLHAG